MLNAKGSECVTITAEGTNVLYAGINNPIRISVPDIQSKDITVYATNNAEVNKTANGYNLKPSIAGKDCEIIILIKHADGSSTAETKSFRVIQLPTPTAYISYQKDGYEQEYRGRSKIISKTDLVNATSIRASLEDTYLDAEYYVTGFDIISYDSMGNTIIRSSYSPQFTEEQKNMIFKLSRGKRFFITSIKVIGQDGIERVLPAIDVIIN
jgi:gliding motility-associated protein GldM